MLSTCSRVPAATPGTRISQPRDPNDALTAFKRTLQSFETWKMTLQMDIQNENNNIILEYRNGCHKWKD